MKVFPNAICCQFWFCTNVDFMTSEDFEDKYILEGRGFQRQGGDLLRFSKAGVKTRHDL